MHIPDGFVCGEVNAATAVISLGACGLALARANRTLGERQVPLLGVAAAFIFAAQMVNFPIAGGTSGHYLGAVLAAILLGPLNAVLIMAIVLLIQCLGFADGGITALGSNVLNMGVVGGGGGYLLFRVAVAILPKTRGSFLASTAVASWASVVLASASCAVELGLSGTSPLTIALPTMAGVHALIGVGESLITGAVVSTVLATRPDLVGAWRSVGVEPELQGA